MLRKDYFELRKKYKIPFIPIDRYINKPNNKSKGNKKVNYRVFRKYTLDGNFVSKIHFNKKNCDDYGLNYTGILLASKPTWADEPKQLKSMNHIWIRETDFSEEELARKIELNKNSQEKIKKVRNHKKIARVDKNTNEILETFDNIDSAGKTEMFYNTRCIRRVLSGERKTYAGYKWILLEN